jgi:hypothetical protein
MVMTLDATLERVALAGDGMLPVLDHESARSHLIKRESSCLVRANDTGATERLHTGKSLHDRILLRHARNTECERDDGDSGKTFRNGRHCECYGGEEELSEGIARDESDDEDQSDDHASENRQVVG